MNSSSTKLFFQSHIYVGGRVSGLASRQDGTQFEDALRRLHALEKKLTDQVLILLAILEKTFLATFSTFYKHRCTEPPVCCLCE